MEFVRPIDFGKFRPTSFHSQMICELESAALICSRVPPGSDGPKTHIHPADQFYYVTTGVMNIELGSKTHVVQPDQLVFIPQGVPHHNWNTGAVDEVHFEVIVPGVPRAVPRSERVEEETKTIDGGAVIALDPNGFPDRDFASQTLISNKNGSEHAIFRVVRVRPGGQSPQAHIHEFDQIYYVLEGTMSLEIALKRYEAGPHTMVILPAGVVHRNWNEGNVDERHVVLITPHPQTESGWDTVVNFSAASA